MYGERIRELRLLNKMSQTELGKLCGVSTTAVYKWENEKSQPDVDTLIKIADRFSVTVDYLLGRNSQNSQIEQEVPDDIAAHTESTVTPEMKVEIENIAKQVFEKYIKKD